MVRMRSPLYVTIALFLISLVGCLSDVAEEGLQVPITQLQVGFVPPSGKVVEIPVSNVSNRSLDIVTVQPSCGCIKVDVPPSLASNSSSKFVIRLQGSNLPQERQASVLVTSRLASKTYSDVIKLRFITGNLPGFIPNEIEIPDAAASASANLWVYTDRPGTIIEVGKPRQPEVTLSFRPSEHYQLLRPNCVVINETGLYDLPIDIKIAPEGLRASQAVECQIKQADSANLVFLKLKSKSGKWIQLLPASTSFDLTGHDMSSTQSRMIGIASGIDGECRVVRKPSFMECKIVKQRQCEWQLYATVRDIKSISGSNESIDVECFNASASLSARLELRFTGLDHSNRN